MEVRGQLAGIPSHDGVRLSGPVAGTVPDDHLQLPTNRILKLPGKFLLARGQQGLSSSYPPPHQYFLTIPRSSAWFYPGFSVRMECGLSEETWVLILAVAQLATV